MPPFLRCLVLGVLLATLRLTTLAAEPGAPAAKRSYAIPAGSLEEALSSYAAAAGVPLSFDPTIVAGKQSGGLSGSYSTLEGFARLLDGSGLELVPCDGCGYILRPMRAEPRMQRPATLPAIIVRPAAEDAWSPVDGYVAQRSAMATKTDTPIVETPRSISVITRDQIEDRGIRNVEQALRYTSGVTGEGGGFDMPYRVSNIRGLPASYYLDGLRMFAGVADWAAEPWGLERIGVLKGPASVMYGQGEPGGIVNLVSKRPSDTPIREAQMTIGNHDRYQVAMDLGGKANEEGSLLYRVVGLARESNTAQMYGEDNRLYLAPSLAIKASPQTKLTLMLEMVQDRAMPENYFPDAPSNVYPGEPQRDRYNRDLASFGYLLEHDVGDEWLFRQGLRYSYSQTDFQRVFGDDYNAPILTRNFESSNSRARSTMLDNTLQKNLRIGNVEHRLLFGLDFQRFDSDAQIAVGSALDLDVNDPVYGGPIDIGRDESATNKLKQTGFYMQDQLRSGKWIVNAGLRYDKARSESRSDEKPTYSAGALYVADNGISPYVSYSTSFAPSARTAVFGLDPNPETGQQFEIGLKYQPADATSLLTASVFDLRKQNVLVEMLDPNRPFLLGEVHAKGLELEWKASLNRRWDLIASFTYLDIDASPAKSSQNFTDEPRDNKNTVAIWLDHKFAGEALRGWSTGGGVRHGANAPIDCRKLAVCMQSSNTYVDAALRYRASAASFALNVNNLLDRETDMPVGYAEGRTIQGTFSYNW